MSAHPISPRYINVRAVAVMFGVSVSTIWRWAAENGAFPRLHQLGHTSTRQSVAELDDYDKRLRDDASREASTAQKGGGCDTDGQTGGLSDDNPVASKFGREKRRTRRFRTTDDGQTGLPFEPEDQR